MAAVAFVLAVVFVVVAFGWRSWAHHRRTGSTGFRGVSGRPGSPEWLGGVLFVVAVLLVLAAPLLQALDVVGAIGVFDHAGIAVAGVVLGVLGFAATIAAQSGMGASWRIGVDDGESTDLVTGGAFALARNPIFTAMVTATLGLVLMAPSWLAVAGLATLVVAVQLQVRAVEEPYLLRLHGAAYRRYAATTGRFLPALGRLPA